MTEPPLLLTVAEAAALLRISRNSAYGLVARHELPALRLGRTIRIPRHALETQIINASAEAAGKFKIEAVR
jgi:excisionase family DNA binding protein